MEFIIKRASDSYSGLEPEEITCPVEGAVLKEIIYEYEGQRYTRKEWVIAINSLQELYDLIDKVKCDLIIGYRFLANNKWKHIKIYDDYLID